MSASYHSRATLRMGLTAAHDAAAKRFAGGNKRASSVVEVRDVESLAPYVGSQRRAQPVMVLFYAPWCPHCTHFFPAFIEAANALQGKAMLVAVNASNREPNSASARVAQTHNVRSFPTIRVYGRNGGAPQPYTGARDAASIVAHMRRK